MRHLRKDKMSSNSVQVEDIYLGSERGIWFVATRVTVVVLLLLTGLLGNGLVLIIYRRNKKQSGAVYIIALAVIDLLSCILLLPQVPITELSDDLEYGGLKIYLEKGFIGMASWSHYSYLFVQVAMALDQVIAVFCPFNYTRMRKKLNRCSISVGTVILILKTIALVQTNDTVWQINLALSVAVLLLCFVILIVSYIATALKLYAQGRALRQQTHRTNTVQLRSISRATGTAANTAQERARAEQQPGKKRAMHVQALKIYTSILLLFFVANLASITIGLFDMKWMTYVYYVNHTANPLIYYCFVEKFRQGVKEYWRRLTGRG